jgi:triacylglycerol lipase
MAKHLSAAGWEAHSVNVLPSWGQLGLDELAGQLAGHVERLVAPGQRVDLVGFSMGGLVCRYYLQRMGGLDRVDRFVSVAAPHHGSMLAWLIPNRGCRQMRPGSEFLRDLASDADRLGKIQFTSLWTPFDLTIVPATSSLMPVGENLGMWVIAHPLMVWQRGCIQAVERALGVPVS